MTADAEKRPRRKSVARALVVGAAMLLAISAVAAAGGAAGPTAPAHGPSSVRQQAAVDVRPNVLLVITDDQVAGTVTPPIMPNTYRELVQRGFRFTNAFVTNPWCCPSRASILTGQYSHTNGVWTVGGPYGMAAWFPHESSTLATWLDRAGYRTGIIGKYFNEYGQPAVPAYKPPGWDMTAIMTDLDYATNSGYFDYDLFESGGLRRYGANPEDYSTRVFSWKARQFMARTSADQPWFLYLSYTSPHGPTISDPLDENFPRDIQYPMSPNVCETDVSDKPAFVRRQPPCTLTQTQHNVLMRDKQGQMLASVDRGLGRIFAHLEATGQMDNTLILYVSDNGNLAGSHRFRDGKELPYEESVRVPLMLRWDALRTTPRSVDAFALNIDLAPTITDAVGVSEHNPYDGTSLLPLISGTASTVRQDFLLEHLTRGPHDPGGPSYCAVRNRRFKYVEYSTRERELYNMVIDPAELDSRHADPALQLTLERLRKRMLQLCQPSPPDWTPR
jgi:arylsulfatase A-like enzyme